MDLASVQATLAALPSSFQRPGTTYAQLQRAFAASLGRLVSESNGMITQAGGAQAAGGKWMDVWGQALGIPRRSGEARSAYLSRFLATCVAWRLSVPALEQFMLSNESASVTVTESFPSVGWTMTLPSPNLLTSGVDLETQLKTVRPAGVPYSFLVQEGGCFLSTSVFMSRSRARGAFLTQAVKPVAAAAVASTPNTAPSLPMTYMTDPTLNPSLATAA